MLLLIIFTLSHLIFFYRGEIRLTSLPDCRYASRPFLALTVLNQGNSFRSSSHPLFLVRPLLALDKGFYLQRIPVAVAARQLSF